MQRISLIIPVLNEADNLERLLPSLGRLSRTDAIAEVLVVDGGSTDRSCEVAAASGARVILAPKGRASQMNAGAEAAVGEILYFLHADSFPPPGFDRAILGTQSSGPSAGCFRLKFDHPSKFLGFFAWFSRFNFLLCRGGDQSLFVPAEDFRALGGFDESYRVYEDVQLIARICRRLPFAVLPGVIRTSARKYRKIGVWRLQYYFAVIHMKNAFGSRPESLYRYYLRKVGEAA